MHSTNFNDRKTKVFNFMESVEEEMIKRLNKEQTENSVQHKQALVKAAMTDAKKYCIETLLNRLYRNAIPLNMNSISGYQPEDDGVVGIIPNKNVLYLVTEGIKKGNVILKNINEAVDHAVSNLYYDKMVNPNNYDKKDLVFATSDELEHQINVINKDIDFDDLSQIIKDNVKNNVLSEITRAKQKKEEMKALEQELANDINIKTESELEAALSLRQLKGKPSIYTPTLFKSILHNKMEMFSEMESSGTLPITYIGDALSSLGYQSEIVQENGDNCPSTIDELGFIEAVKDYTKWNVLKALKVQEFNKSDISSIRKLYI